MKNEVPFTPSDDVFGRKGQRKAEYFQNEDNKITKIKPFRIGY